MTREAAAAPWIKSRFVKRLSGRALATVGKGARGLRATGSFVRGWDLVWQFIQASYCIILRSTRISGGL